MTSAGPRTIEIRTHTGAEYQVSLVGKCAEAVYVLQAFQTQKPPAAAPKLARHHYRELLAERRTAVRNAIVDNREGEHI